MVVSSIIRKHYWRWSLTWWWTVGCVAWQVPFHPRPIPQSSTHLAAIGSQSSSSSSSTAAISNVNIGRVQAGPITISALGCGTWSWGNRLLWNYNISQDEEIYRAYETVRNAGVTVFDTADSYGTFDLNGRAEILLGVFERRYQQDRLNVSALKGTINKNSNWLSSLFASPPSKAGSTASSNAQQVATKFAPYPWRITRGSLLQAAKESLQRLQQDRVSIAQLHWSTANYQPFQEGALWEGLADIYDAGLCDAVGVSNYGPVQLEKIATRLQQRHVPLATAQIQYSLMTYGTARFIEQTCRDVNCRLISYSPLCLGLLSGKYDLNNLPPPGNPRRQLFRELLPGAQSLVQTIHAVATEYEKTPTQIAINWALCHDTVPIPGCRTIEQAVTNVQAAAGWQLQSDAMEELDQQALLVKKPMIQNIFQTK